MILRAMTIRCRSLYTQLYVQCVTTFLLLFVGTKLFADSNPFPDIDTSGGDIVQVAGAHMETALKYGLLASGGFLILGSLGILINRMREDSRDKEHGNLLTTFIMVGLGLTVGFILIAIGWKAFSVKIES